MKSQARASLESALQVKVALAVSVLMLVSCGPPPGPEGGESLSSPQTTIQALDLPEGGQTNSPTTRMLSVVEDPELTLQFWASKALPGAIEAEQFKSIKEMADASGLVVIAEIAELVDGPTIKLAEGEDAVSEYTLRAYRLKVSEVLLGDLSSDEVEVHFAVMPTDFDAQDVGEAIFFLRSGTTEVQRGAELGAEADWFIARYRLVSSQGLFIVTPQGLTNPLSEAQNEGLDPILQAWGRQATGGPPRLSPVAVSYLSTLGMPSVGFPHDLHRPHLPSGRSSRHHHPQPSGATQRYRRRDAR